MGVSYTPNDKWAQKAQNEGFRARSVYKLQELDQKYHLLQPGMNVLDVGAAPGSWLQYAAKIVDRVTGIDLQEIAPIADNVTTIVADINDFKPSESYDVILSDIAPSTTGMPNVDQKRSIELNESIFELAKRALKPGGHLVMKVFEGQAFQEFMRDLKNYFQEVHTTKVRASRTSSHEIYVICR